MKPKTFVLIIKYFCIFLLGALLVNALQSILPYLNVIIIDLIWLIVCVCNFELDS